MMHLFAKIMLFPSYLRGMLPLVGWGILLAGTGFCESLSVMDTNGRAIVIEVLGVSGGSVNFKRVSDAKLFTLPLKNFDNDSQEKIREEGARLAALPPKIQAEVVIGKRRKKQDGSSYQVRQEITSTINLANPSKTMAVPEVQVNIVFIGQDQRRPDVYSVISSQQFNAVIEAGTTFTKETNEFYTTYDSDNKGSGNIGGFQYYGYVLVISDKEGKVIQAETTTGAMRQAFTERPQILNSLIKYPKGTMLDKRLEKY